MACRSEQAPMPRRERARRGPVNMGLEGATATYGSYLDPDSKQQTVKMRPSEGSEHRLVRDIHEL